MAAPVQQPSPVPPVGAGGSRPALASLAIGIIVGLIVAAIAAVIVVGPLMVGHRQDLPLERLYGSFAVSVAARLGAGNAQNPLGQGSPNFRATGAGRNAYIGSCAECHGANGEGKGVFGQATYPPATDLTTGDAKEKSDAELFWIVKNGLSFTGMPAFGDQYSDQDIWSMVSYLRTLQSPGQAQSFVGGRNLAVPTPSAEQLALADPTGDSIHRGAAIYFAQGCAACHGPTGNAPGELALRGGGREAENAVRDGPRGMPSYDPRMINDEQMQDLVAYMNTFSNQRGFGFGQGGRGTPTSQNR